MSDIYKCPKCGGTEIGQGKLAGYAAMRVVGRMFSSSVLVSDVCANCGLVIQTKAEKPERFKPKR
jgi:predicted RNA-binding Zn-ribbon protein involved in translation (DUF1610 family)